MASLTNSVVNLFYCEVDMSLDSEEEPITLVVQYLVSREAQKLISLATKYILDN